MPRIKCRICGKTTLHTKQLQINGTQIAIKCILCGNEHYEAVKMSAREREKREQKWIEKLWNIEEKNIKI